MVRGGIVSEAHPHVRTGQIWAGRPLFQCVNERLRNGLVGSDVASKSEMFRAELHHLGG